MLRNKKILIILIALILCLMPVFVFAVENSEEVVVNEENNLREVLTNGGTYVLKGDIDAVESFTVPKGVIATIDLNGYTLSHTYAATKAHALITNNGTLTINDSKGSGVITFTDSGTGGNWGSNTIQNNGTLTVNGGAIINASSQATANVGYCHAIDNNKALTINGGTIKSEQYSAIRVWCTTDDDTSVVVNNGTIVNPIDMHNVNGNANKGTLTINNGTFTSTGLNGDYTKYNVRLVNFGADYDEILMRINNGNFNGGILAVVQDADLTKILSVSGGTFDFDVKPYLTENKKQYESGVVGCAHESNYQEPARESTYVENGNVAYYVCNDCKKMFSDAACELEVTVEDVTLPKLIEIKENGEAILQSGAVKDAIEASKDSDVVELSVGSNTETVTSVTVPVVSMEAVVEKDKGLLIETSDALVTLDAKTVAEVAKQADGSISLTIEVVKVEEEALTETQKEAIKDKEVAIVLSAQIIADGKTISDFKGGKVTVEVPFVPAENVKVEDYKVVYISDDGKVEEIPFKYVDGKIVLELEHFSEYAIVKDIIDLNETEKDEVAEKDESPKTGSGSIVVCVIMISLVGLAVTKKRK